MAQGARHERIFGEPGAARVTALDFDSRRDCEEPGLRFVGEVAA